MKNIIKISFSLFILILIPITLSSCTSVHIHKYSYKWSYNDEVHYHEAICEHKDLVKNKESHKWNDGTIIKEATIDEEGIMEYECKICGYKKQIEISKKSSNQNEGNWDFID